MTAATTPHLGDILDFFGEDIFHAARLAAQRGHARTCLHHLHTLLTRFARRRSTPHTDVWLTAIAEVTAAIHPVAGSLHTLREATLRLDWEAHLDCHHDSLADCATAGDGLDPAVARAEVIGFLLDAFDQFRD